MIQQALRAYTFLFLLSSIAGCANQQLDANTVYQQVYIPDSMLSGCPGVAWSGGDFQAIADLAEARRTALKDCDARFTAARKYQDDLRAKEAAGKVKK